MALTGDISRVQRIAHAIRQELPRVPSRVAATVSAGIFNAIQDEFDAGQDPYGEDWNPLAASTLKKHGPPPLTDTTVMRGSLSVAPRAGAGLAISIDHPSAFHQRGFEPLKEQTKRPILPTRGLPETWDDLIFDAADAEFRKVLA